MSVIIFIDINICSKLTLLIFTVIITFVIIIIIMIKKLSLSLEFYNPGAGFLLVTWGNREYFNTASIFI